MDRAAGFEAHRDEAKGGSLSFSTRKNRQVSALLLHMFARDTRCGMASVSGGAREHVRSGLRHLQMTSTYRISVVCTPC